MIKRLKAIHNRYGAEIYRGTAAGLIMTLLFFFCAWKPAPSPRIGEKKSTVITAYGPPESIIHPKQTSSPFVYLLYRSGLFKSSLTVITIDVRSDTVLNVTQDGDYGY